MADLDEDVEAEKSADTKVYVTHNRAMTSISITMTSDLPFDGDDVFWVLTDFCFKYEDQAHKILDGSTQVFDKIQ